MFLRSSRIIVQAHQQVGTAHPLISKHIEVLPPLLGNTVGACLVNRIGLDRTFVLRVRAAARRAQIVVVVPRTLWHKEEDDRFSFLRVNVATLQVFD